MNMKTESISGTALSNSINAIHSCPDELCVLKLIRAMLEPANITSFLFIFHSLNPSNSSVANYRLQIGCRSEFAQLYVARKWYVNDPAILHARKSSAVAMLDELPLTSAGQHDMREASRRMGFRSAIVIPAHSGHSGRFGVFVAGADAAPPEQDRVLLAHRIALRSMAMELLDWWTGFTREEARRRLALSDLELMILSLQRREYRGSDIASELNVSAKTIHNAVRTIKEKFGAASIGMALSAAEAYGLI